MKIFLHKIKNWLLPYTSYTCILMFFIFSMIGWLWEVLLHVIMYERFINRGFLKGPWLPIYGFGAVLIIILFHRMTKKPIKTFFLIIICSCVLEYVTSVGLEQLFGIRWWDYSSYSFNLHGRICLLCALGFGIGGMFVLYIVAPWLNTQIHKHISIPIQRMLCIALLLLFLLDEMYSFVSPNVGVGISSFCVFNLYPWFLH